jgi:hypothetical protein
MPPAWVDFSWAMVRGERDNVKQISVVVVVAQSWRTGAVLTNTND